MKKEYRKIEFCIGCSIENAVNNLQSYRNKGELVYGVFNGVTLYSDTVTLEDAFKEITGITIDEQKKHKEYLHKERERQEEEFKKSLPRLIEQWKQKAGEVLSEDKWSYWDEIVPIRANDLYRGMELDNCLDIAKMLNAGESFAETNKVLLNQGHSGMSFGLICCMIKEFCNQGKDFVDYVNSTNY